MLAASISAYSLHRRLDDSNVWRDPCCRGSALLRCGGEPFMSPWCTEGDIYCSTKRSQYLHHRFSVSHYLFKSLWYKGKGIRMNGWPLGYFACQHYLHCRCSSTHNSLSRGYQKGQKNKIRPSNCDLCDYLFDKSLISLDCQSGSIGQTSPGAPSIKLICFHDMHSENSFVCCL